MKAWDDYVLSQQKYKIVVKGESKNQKHGLSKRENPGQ